MMNFQCEELSLSDDELGFTITFSDSKSSDDQFKTVEEILNSQEKYLLIQRTYPEDEFDFGYYYIESSETETEFNSRDKMIVRLSQDKFKIDWSNAHVEIGLNLSEIEYKELKEAFENTFSERAILLE